MPLKFLNTGPIFWLWSNSWTTWTDYSRDINLLMHLIEPVFLIFIFPENNPMYENLQISRKNITWMNHIHALCSELLSHFQYCVLSFLFFIWPFGYISFYPFFPSGQFIDLPSLWLFFCFLTLISACRSLFLIFLLWFCAYCLCPFLKVLSV